MNISTYGYPCSVAPEHRAPASPTRRSAALDEPEGKLLDRIEEFAQNQGVMFPGGPRGAWLPVDALLDILGERAR